MDKLPSSQTHITNEQFLEALGVHRDLAKIMLKAKNGRIPIRLLIQAYIETEGNYYDPVGYERMAHYEGQWRCKDANALANLASIMSKSKDGTIKACGDSIMQFLEMKPAVDRLYVK